MQDGENLKSGLSDEELMSLYQNGDFAAFEVLYRRHSGRVYEYLRKKTPSSEIAMDLTQGTFEKLHKSRSKYSSQYPLLPWLFAISRNTLVDYFKSSETKLTKAVQDPEILLENLAQPVLQAESPDITLALATLPHGQRQAIELRYLRDWSFEKIATHMNTSEDNARQLISRGLKRVREFFGKGDLP